MEQTHTHIGISPSLLRTCEARTRAPYSQFASHDVDDVRDYIGRVFCRHRLGITNRQQRLETQIDHIRVGDVAIAIMQYGADVLIEPGPLESFYLVQIPLTGRARINFGSSEQVVRPGTASVQHPVDPLRMEWTADCRKLVLRFDRIRFERFAESHLGRPLHDAVRLRPEMNLSSAAGLWLVDQIEAAMRGIGHCDDGRLPPLLAAHLETSLMTALLYLQPHDRSDILARGPDRREPQVVAVVRDYLEAHIDEPVDMARLACIAGVPVRTLYHQFRQTIGVAPLQLLRDMRMERVHGELVAAGPDVNVTRVAMEWGFDHLGRFSAQYRQRYGESPRDTLRRHRGVRPH